jgi:hypothetical protein
MENQNLNRTNIFSKENFQLLKNISKSCPNDYDFGKKIRNSFFNDIFVRSIPNNTSLGIEVRKFILNLDK